MNVTEKRSEENGQVLALLNVKQIPDERMMYMRTLGYHQIKSSNFGKKRFTDSEICNLLFNLAMEDSFFHEYTGIIISRKYCDHKDIYKPVYVIFLKLAVRETEKWNHSLFGVL